MKLHLCHHWHAGGVLVYDTADGSVIGKSTSSRQAAQWGFLWQQRGRWFAIYKDDESLIFQHEQQSWRLKPDIALHVTKGQLRKFQIISGSESVFEFRYLFKGFIQSLIDVTYDGIDEELDDFFLYVTHMWDHWKDRDIDLFQKT